jgi:3-dehydroquinate synthase
MTDGLGSGREPPQPEVGQTSRWQQRLSVGFCYPVVFTRGMFRADNLELVRAIVGTDDARQPDARQPDARQRGVFVVLDEGVARAWPGLASDIQAYFVAHAGQLTLIEPEPYVIIGGEAAKNDAAVIQALQAALFAAKVDRHSVVLIIGGGAVLDAAGYAAAVCHRGLRIVRAPTTVLAQNDAGIGVKNGVNAFGVKNALGTFAPPLAVINDLDFIATLPARDRLAGLAEALKVGLIRDPEFVGWLSDNAQELFEGAIEATATMIRRCAELHLAHIRDGGDPFELGSARPLDFGHWAAHKLEMLSHHELRHGEAVAIGIAIDSRYSALSGRLAPAMADEIEALIAKLGLPLWHEALLLRDANGHSAVLAGLEEFREHLGGELTITVLEGLGQAVEVHEIDMALMLVAIERANTKKAG